MLIEMFSKKFVAYILILHKTPKILQLSENKC